MVPQQLERLYPTKLPWELHLFYGAVRQHMMRYRFAAERVHGMQVLDVACGSGYGCMMLGEHATHVVGVDISQEAIDYARVTYSSDTVEYVRSDARQLPFADNSFDCVVSFETIEHLVAKDVTIFLKEVQRVLKPGGILFISTPEKRNLSLGRVSSNKFHEHEYSCQEFVSLISQYVIVTEVYGQEFASKWKVSLLSVVAKGFLDVYVQKLWRLYQASFGCSGDLTVYSSRSNAIPMYVMVEGHKSV